MLAVPEYKPYVDSGKLELYVTGSLGSGDYSKVLKGAHAVIHVASPVAFGDQEYRKTHHDPAVKGTAEVLYAAAKEPSVESVVMTSTVGERADWSLVLEGFTARAEPRRQVPWPGSRPCLPTRLASCTLKTTGTLGPPRTWTNWPPPRRKSRLKSPRDEQRRLTCLSKHPFGDGYLFYMTGKKYAELEAWKVQKETGAKWPLATINCVIIFGPASECPSFISSQNGQCGALLILAQSSRWTA